MGHCSRIFNRPNGEVKMEILKRAIDKLLSGRFILTVICGVVFAWAATHKLLEAAAIASILTSVFTSYFDRQDRTKGG